MSRIGVIGVPGGWSSERLVEAVKKRAGSSTLVDPERILLDVEAGRLRFDEQDASSFDALIVKKLGATYSAHQVDRLKVLAFAYERGLKVFSDPRNILKAFDRLSCTLALRLGNLPIPPTVITENAAEAVEAIRRFRSAVLKPIFTSKARGMELVRHTDDVPRRLADFLAAGNKTLYVQKLIPLPQRDLSVAFLGGSYIATYARVREEDCWTTTTHFGGKYESCEPTDDVLRVAQKAADLFALDFTCVDVAEGEEGPLVFEVSPFGGFRGLWKANGIDAAERYAEYVIGKLAHG